MTMPANRLSCESSSEAVGMKLVLELMQRVGFERLDHQQRIDKEAVAERRRDAARRSVRAGDVAQFLEVRHHVSDRGRRQVQPRVLGQRARAYRLTLGDVMLDQRFQQDLCAAVEHDFIVHKLPASP
jgi:hypothetical protein